MGRELQNNFTFVFAVLMEIASVIIALDAWFHILVASPMNVFGVQFIMNFSEEALLVVAPFNIG